MKENIVIRRVNFIMRPMPKSSPFVRYESPNVRFGDKCSTRLKLKVKTRNLVGSNIDWTTSKIEIALSNMYL